jgi:PAS domain S-box-containing protein
VGHGFAFAFAFASLIPVAFLIFSHSYPAAPAWSSAWHVRIAFGVGIILAGFSLGTDLVIHDARIGSDGLTRQSGILYPVFAAFFISTWCLGLWIFLKKWRASRGLARAQFHYLGAGLVGGSIGGISTNLLIPLITGQSTYSWVGPYFSLVYVGFIAHAIIRHRLMDLRLFIHRGLTLAAAVAVSTLPVWALIGLLWPRLSVLQLTSLQVVLLLGIVGAVTLLVPVTRDVSGRLLDRYLYRTHADYQRTLREASQVLTRVLHLDKLLPFISATVARSTGAAGVAIYLRSEGRFRHAITETPQAVEHFEAPPELDTALLNALRTAQEPILTDELSSYRDDTLAPLQNGLTERNWALLLPVSSEDALIAVIAVGSKLSGDPFYRQDIDLLMTLANQAAVALKNAQLYAAAVVANEHLENIVATLESGVIAIDAAGHISIFNRAAQQLMGLPAPSALRHSATVLPSPIAARLLNGLRDEKVLTDPEIELTVGEENGGGQITRPVICTTSPVRDPFGVVVGAVAVVSDLTSHKQLQIERRSAERLAYFQALASGIAHEIKNPLVAIKTFAQLLPRRQDDGKFLGEFSRISVREIERVQRLAERLRILSYPSDGSKHPIDLRTPLRHASEFVRPMLDEKQIALVAHIADTPGIVLGNEAELQQLFLNILLNAHDATPAGGTIAIEMSMARDLISVSISDTGPGIAPELLGRIFDPFFTTKARGSGLGLAISSSIAQVHGANLRAGNGTTGGAVFSLEFPVMATTPSVTA